MRVAGPERVDAVLRHGWQSWSASGWVAPDAPFPRARRLIDRRNADHPHVDRSAHESCDMAALADGDEVVLLGALRPGAVVRVELDEPALVGSGPEPCEWFSARGPEHEVLDAYARALAGTLGARRSVRAPRVWCSWYSLGPRLDPDVLATAVDDLGEMPFDVVQVDDGWQQVVGHWHPRPGFTDMPGLAARLAAGGRRAGLWLAPFLVDAAAPLASSRRSWLVGGDDDGSPLVVADNWGRDVHALDVTRPEVVEHVVAQLRRAVEWGFTYLKLDFLYGAALPGRRADDDTHPEDAYRAALQAIRDEVGEDVYLLGCGAPVLASLGLVDGLRIGPDVAPWWDDPPATSTLGHLGYPSARYALTTSIGRTWLAPLVDIDPDVVLLRSQRNLLGPVTRGHLADLARVCGFVGTSDPIGWLTSDEVDELHRLLVERPTVVPLGRARWAIDGREVDLSAVTTAPPGVPVASPDGTAPARLPEVV